MLARALVVLMGVLGLGFAVAAADASTSHERFANCTRAVAALGPAKSRIDLAVDCWAPRRGGEFGFSFTRLDSREEASMRGIRYFGRQPVVTGPGAVSGHGRCVGWAGGFAGFNCWARSRGPVTLHETIRVRPATRCARRLYVTAKVTTCEPTVRAPCPASLKIAELFRGLPRGC